ncbi:hypothetical protein [Aggregatilinea lenta]|uniref:hypothetical protein n=1 Tax=Aggregatilinea lenta TaxID=913108 RepID=UPI000E5C5370|nr:hypothetical protein [Aggregatilinea lenta]
MALESSQRFLPAYLLHKQVYIDVLRGVLSTHGTKRFVAEAAQISPVYLSNILNLDHHPPSSDVAGRIIAALPVDSVTKRILEEHMSLARQSRAVIDGQMRYAARYEMFEDMLHDLQGLYGQSTFGSTAAQTKHAYAALAEQSRRLLKIVNPARYPNAYVRICMLGQDALSVLNQHSDALWFGLQAKYVIERSNPAKQSREDFEYLQANTYYALSVTYRNLNLHQQARDICHQTVALLKPDPRLSRFWMPHVLRDEIKALAHLRRFAIGDAEGLYFQARAMLDWRDGPDDELLDILLQQAMAEAYVGHGTTRSLRKADEVLNWQIDALPRRVQVGPIHTTILLKTFAHLRWKQGSNEEWRYFVNQALDVARRTGLQHQVDQIQRQYGAALGR